MKDYPRATHFNCKKCGKELGHIHRNYPPYNKDTCADCEYLELLGIQTTQDYNNYLRGEK